MALSGTALVGGHPGDTSWDLWAYWQGTLIGDSAPATADGASKPSGIWISDCDPICSHVGGTWYNSSFMESGKGTEVKCCVTQHSHRCLTNLFH